MVYYKKITLTALPKSLTGRTVIPSRIIKEPETVEYLERMKPFIFGRRMMKCIQKTELDLFSFLFVQDKPFHDYVKCKVDRIYDGAKDTVRLAILVNLLYKGKNVRMIQLQPDGDDIAVGEPRILMLNVIDASADYGKKNARLQKKMERNSRKEFSPNKRAKHFADTAELSVAKYYMNRALAEKELIDKLNYRRFSTGLRINNRPVTTAEMERLLRAKTHESYFDFSDVTIRLGLSALYAVTYKGFDLDDLCSVDYVFSEKSSSREHDLSESASELLELLYNGNGIEVAAIFVRMIQTFADLPLPPLETVDLVQICRNYSLYYTITSLAYIFDGAFAKNQDFKSYIRHKMIGDYWRVYQRILKLKQLSTVVSLCHFLSKVDLRQYRDVPSYEERVVLEFAKAEDAVRYMNDEK